MERVWIDDDRPVYLLDARPVFPDPTLARRDGLLAVGGDLSVARLLEAYRLGLFPWSGPDEPLLWWSPDPRLILVPDELRVSRSLRATLRRERFAVRCDTSFPRVIHECASVPRREGEGSWITPEVEAAYTALHARGYAHSVETWCGDALVGGLYGVLLGRCFFGESMFAHETDASKVALVALARVLRGREVALIDCQVKTAHLMSLGAREVARAEFLARLREALEFPTDLSRWPASVPDLAARV